MEKGETCGPVQSCKVNEAACSRPPAERIRQAVHHSPSLTRVQRWAVQLLKVQVQYRIQGINSLNLCLMCYFEPLGKEGIGPLSVNQQSQTIHHQKTEVTADGDFSWALVFFAVFHQGESSQLDLDSMVVPGLSSFSTDEAAMAVIMSLLETDVNMGQSGDFEDLHWPF